MYYTVTAAHMSKPNICMVQQRWHSACWLVNNWANQGYLVTLEREV